MSNKETVAELIATALEEMDLRSMESLLDLCKDSLRKDIEEIRRRILERERWDRAPVVLSDYSEPERSREQILAGLHEWHDKRQKQLHFVHKLSRAVSEMHSKREAPKMVAAILAGQKERKQAVKVKCKHCGGQRTASVQRCPSCNSMPDQKNRRPLKKGTQGIECDWGGCSKVAVLERRSTSEGWLPVCAACNKKRGK